MNRPTAIVRHPFLASLLVVAAGCNGSNAPPPDGGKAEGGAQAKVDAGSDGGLPPLDGGNDGSQPQADGASDASQPQADAASDGSTAQKAWGTAVLIETSMPDVRTGPKIAMNGTGDAFAAWVQGDGTANHIWASHFAAGGGWDVPEIINTTTAPSSDAPAIAMNASGDAFAVWLEYEDISTPVYNVWAARYAAGQWGAPALIQTGVEVASAPGIAVDASGNAVAVWIQDSYSLHYVWANRFAAGAWGTAQKLDTAAVYPPAQVGMDASGNALAVWLRTSAGLAGNRYTAGTGWGTAAVVAAPPSGMSELDPELAMNAAGDAWAIWHQVDSASMTTIASARYQLGAGFGAGWQPVETIEQNIDIGSGSGPRIAIDAHGDGFAVWGKRNGNEYPVYAAMRPALTNWGSPVRADNNVDTGGSTLSDIAVNDGGDAFAVWNQHDGTTWNVWSNRRLATDVTWGTPELIDTSATGSSLDPRIVVDTDGNALAVWRRNDGTRFNVWANRFH